MRARAWLSLKPRGVKACMPRAPTLFRHGTLASAWGGVLAAGKGNAADGLYRHGQSHTTLQGHPASPATVQATSSLRSQAVTCLAERGVVMPSRVLAALSRRAIRSRESVTSCSLLVHASPMASWMPALCSSDLNSEADTNQQCLTVTVSASPGSHHVACVAPFEGNVCAHPAEASGATADVRSSAADSADDCSRAVGAARTCIAQLRSSSRQTFWSRRPRVFVFSCELHAKP